MTPLTASHPSDRRTKSQLRYQAWAERLREQRAMAQAEIRRVQEER
jgi:hypothetical protein